MESDPLQQLRDVHLPPDPSWWPPAIGWWLLIALAMFAVIWLIRWLISTYLSRAPIRASKVLLAETYSAYRTERLSAVEFLHAANELLKRLLVRAFGRTEVARLAGEEWLQELDRLSATEFFSSGAGRVLGLERFSRSPDVDVDEINRHLHKILSKVRP